MHPAASIENPARAAEGCLAAHAHSSRSHLPRTSLHRLNPLAGGHIGQRLLVDRFSLLQRPAGIVDGLLGLRDLGRVLAESQHELGEHFGRSASRAQQSLTPEIERP